MTVESTKYPYRILFETVLPKEDTVWKQISDFLVKRARERFFRKVQPKIERFAILERQAEACAMDVEARFPIWHEMLDICQYIHVHLEAADGFLERDEYWKIKFGLTGMHEATKEHACR
jgi:hypothetical protein